MGRKGELRGTAVTSGSLLERESSLGVILMLPGALLLMVFMAYPFFLGIWLSLTDSAIGRGIGQFIGLRNFADLLTDTIFHQTAWNTFVYAMVTVPFKAALGLGLALVLNNHMRFSNPDPGGGDDALDRADGAVHPRLVHDLRSGVQPLLLAVQESRPHQDRTSTSWATRSLAISSVCLANIWRGVPFFGITILAGLQAVPNELHEAAAIDGAGLWHRFRHVTVPHIKGVVMIAALLSVIWTFADFQLIYVLTKGGPANQTHIFGTYAYQIGLSATEIGMGAAIALYMFPILMVFAIILLAYLRREE